MMKYAFFFIIGLFAAACTLEEQEVKDFNDILPSSERDYDVKDSTTEESSDTLAIYQAEFEILGVLDSIKIYDEDLFPDRVGPNSMQKYCLSVQGENVVFVKWIFSDSARVTNALFNWSDCFGPSCKSIRIGEEKNLQTNAFQVLANDTALIYLESPSSLNSKKWDSYFEQQGYELDWNYRLEQSRRGRVRWFNYIEEEKTRIENNTL